MNINEKVLEIVKIISKNSKMKDKIIENTNIILNILKTKDIDKYIIEEFWEFIVLICLECTSGSELLLDEEDYEEYEEILTIKEYNKTLSIEFEEDDCLEAPVCYFDWREYVEDYILELQYLLKIQKTNITLQDVQYNEDKEEISTISPKIYNKLKPLGYLLINISLSSSYHICILEESDFNKIKNIISQDNILLDVIKLEHFNRVF